MYKNYDLDITYDIGRSEYVYISIIYYLYNIISSWSNTE